MNTPKVAWQILKEVYISCCNILKIKDIYLYGSYARGDFNKDSDIDILITVNENNITPNDRHNVAIVSSDLSLKYDITVSIILKSLSQFNRHSYLPYYRNVLKDGIKYRSEVIINE